LRQFRHFLFILGHWLLAAAGHIARRPGLIGKDVADLRASGQRKRDGRCGKQSRKTGQDEWSKHQNRSG